MSCPEIFGREDAKFLSITLTSLILLSTAFCLPAVKVCGINCAVLLISLNGDLAFGWRVNSSFLNTAVGGGGGKFSLFIAMVISSWGSSISIGSDMGLDERHLSRSLDKIARKDTFNNAPFWITHELRRDFNAMTPVLLLQHKDNT